MGLRGKKPTLPPEYLGKYRGSPILQVRLQPDLWDQVQARGGVKWVRDILKQLLASGGVVVQEEEAFRQHVEKVVMGNVRAVRHDHPGQDLSALSGSIAKRVGTQLWGELKLVESEAAAIKEKRTLEAEEKPVGEQPEQ